MRTIEVKLFQFDELSDSAKEKAREWYREGNPNDLLDNMLESFETAAELLGITFESRTVSLMNGKTRQESDIRYSGFSSQGDGASFGGSFEFAKGCSKAIRAEFSEDKTLHRIADELTVLQSRKVLGSQNCEPITAKITQSGSYFHMDVEINEDEDGETILQGEDADTFRDLMRDFAQWIYDSLEAEHDYQNSNEVVDENILGNEYEFDEEGERA